MNFLLKFFFQGNVTRLKRIFKVFSGTTTLGSLAVSGITPMEIKKLATLLKKGELSTQRYTTEQKKLMRMLEKINLSNEKDAIKREKMVQIIENWSKKNSKTKLKMSSSTSELSKSQLYTGFKNAPNSWLKSLLFDKFTGKGLFRTSKGRVFRTDLTAQIVDIMSKSSSPGLVLWNTAWLHKRRVHISTGKKMSDKTIWRNYDKRDDLMKFMGIPKYHKVNRKW